MPKSAVGFSSHRRPASQPDLPGEMVLNPLAPFLQDGGTMVLDGALATELERRGAQIQDDPLWSARILVENPALIRQVHFDYFVAGADAAITASYQASFQGFARRGLDEAESVALLARSVALARQARDEFWADPAHRAGRIRPVVAASVGSYGAFLADGSEYRGDYGLSVEELMAWHRPRMAALVDAGPDLLACETLPCLAEGEALVRLLAEFAPMPAWLSFSCCDAARVCHGELFADCAALADRSAQVVAVGLNCTPPPLVADLLRAAAQATSKPLLAYPNSGESWDAQARCWLPGTGVTDFAGPAQIWRQAGARLIGGCCRTTPADIHTIRHAIAER